MKVNIIRLPIDCKQPLSPSVKLFFFQCFTLLSPRYHPSWFWPEVFFFSLNPFTRKNFCSPNLLRILSRSSQIFSSKTILLRHFIMRNYFQPYIPHSPRSAYPPPPVNVPTNQFLHSIFIRQRKVDLSSLFPPVFNISHSTDFRFPNQYSIQTISSPFYLFYSSSSFTFWTTFISISFLLVHILR